MRLENLSASDARRLLCERKYFGLRPQPLEQYLYAMKLSQCAERVFWLQWDAGYRRGDFTSEVPLSEVARRVKANTSSVTRAYQALKRLGLIRRQDPGRDPTKPFCQATAVTEVLLPRAALKDLLGAPDRQVSCATGTEITTRSTLSPTQDSEAKESASVATVQKENATAPQTNLDALRVKFTGRQASERVFAKLTGEEKTSFFNAQRQMQGGQKIDWQPSSSTKLDAEEVAWLQDFLSRYRQDTEGEPAGATTPKVKSGNRPAVRQISSFTLAYLRKQISQHTPGSELDYRFREIVWAVEEGALAKFEPRFAVNIALKKLKEGLWTRPNKMPPNWRRAVA